MSAPVRRRPVDAARGDVEDLVLVADGAGVQRKVARGAIRDHWWRAPRLPVVAVEQLAIDLGDRR